MAAAEAAMESLPPGVYFNPSPEECVNDYLLPWARGERLPETGRYIHEQSVYAQGPDALRRMWAPGSTRAFEPKWYFLSRRQRRGGRAVATGGSWAVEQKQRVLLEACGDDDGDVPVPGGTRKSYGFFLGKKKKTPWLMEEFTAGEVKGEEEEPEEVPVLCRIYVSPRATTDEKRAIFGEDGVAVDANKKKKPERVVIPADHFDALKTLLPPARASTGKMQTAPTRDALGSHSNQAAPPPTFLGRQSNQSAPPPPPVHLGRQRSQAVPMVPNTPQSQAVLQRNVPVHQHGHPLPPLPRPDFLVHRHQPAPWSVHSPPQKEEEAIRPAKRCRRLTTHSAPPQHTEDTLQRMVIQVEPATMPPLLPPITFDACHAAKDLFPYGGFVDLLETPLLPFADDVFYHGKIFECTLPHQLDDGEALPDVDFLGKDDFCWS